MEFTLIKNSDNVLTARIDEKPKTINALIDFGTLFTGAIGEVIRICQPTKPHYFLITNINKELAQQINFIFSIARTQLLNDMENYQITIKSKDNFKTLEFKVEHI